MHVLRNILASSRYLIIISVLGTLIGSIIVLGYGAITVVAVLIHIFFVRNIFTTGDIKIVAASSVELIDLFLLSTILYIVSLGLYKLFIDSKLPLPGWLEIGDLNDLKERILGVIGSPSLRGKQSKNKAGGKEQRVCPSLDEGKKTNQVGEDNPCQVSIPQEKQPITKLYWCH